MIAATNPAAFHARYFVPTEVPVLGPYPGTAKPGGEQLQLERPDIPDTNGVPYIVVDAVRYGNKAPWPAAADGGGLSLQRINSARYGDDPVNWAAAVPTPGQMFATADTDSDGLPDAWEIANGTDPFSPDASADPDEDGMTNWQEYLAGTNPTNAASLFRMEASLGSDGGWLTLGFSAVAGHAYTLYRAGDLGSATVWQPVTNVHPEAAGIYHFRLPTTSSGQQFYRLGTQLTK